MWHQWVLSVVLWQNTDLMSTKRCSLCLFTWLWVWETRRSYCLQSCHPFGNVITSLRNIAVSFCRMRFQWLHISCLQCQVQLGWIGIKGIEIRSLRDQLQSNETHSVLARVWYTASSPSLTSVFFLCPCLVLSSKFTSILALCQESPIYWSPCKCFSTQLMENEEIY